MYRKNDDRAPFLTPIRQTNSGTFVINIDDTDFVLDASDQAEALAQAKMLCKKQKSFKRFPYFESGYSYDHVKINLSTWLASTYRLSRVLPVKIYNLLFVSDPLSKQGIYFSDTIIAKHAVTVCSDLMNQTDDLQAIAWYEGLAELKVEWLVSRKKAYDEIQLRKKVFNYFTIEKLNKNINHFINNWQTVGIDSKWVSTYHPEIVETISAFGKLYFRNLEDAVTIAKDLENTGNMSVRVIDGDMTIYYLTKGTPTLAKINFSEYTDVLSGRYQTEYDEVRQMYKPLNPDPKGYFDYLLNRDKQK